MSIGLRNFLVINISLLVALMLTLFPLPTWAEPFRPDWVALVLIYWCLALPNSTGLGTGFVFGLILDIATGTLLGQHSLGLTLIAFIMIKNHQRIRVFPLAQQGVIIMLALILKLLLFLWIYGITKRAPDNLWLYFSPAIVGMLLWPWLFILLRDIRRRFTVFSK